MYYMPQKIQKAIKCIFLIGYMLCSAVLSVLFAAWILNKTSPEFAGTAAEFMTGDVSFVTLIQYLDIASAYILDFILFVPIAFYVLRKRDIPLKKISLKNGVIIASAGATLNTVLTLISLGLFVVLKISIPQTIIPTGTMMIAFAFQYCLIGPLTEELYFRYAMIGLFKENKYLGIAISSILFAIVHINVTQMAVALISGIIFGIIYVRTENFTITLIMHIAFNTLATIMSFNTVTGITVAIVLAAVTIAQLLHKNKREKLVKNFGFTM